LPEKIKLAREYVRKASLTYDLEAHPLLQFLKSSIQDKVLNLITALTPSTGDRSSSGYSRHLSSNYLAFI
jgi:hypothetical protein